MVRWLGILFGTSLRSSVRTHRELALENLALRQTARGVESAPTAATVEGDGPDFLGRVVEALDELAEFFAAGAARDRGAVAPPGFPTLLDVEESADGPVGP
jgi:hypothetical protein